MKTCFHFPPNVAIPSVAMAMLIFLSIDEIRLYFLDILYGSMPHFNQ
ncbi:MAG: hypothetical protein HYT93_04135 [Parcubacteria group bacterium]|nr:hypothetical protein [Parcubacteria group bacterium]